MRVLSEGWNSFAQCIISNNAEITRRQVLCLCGSRTVEDMGQSLLRCPELFAENPTLGVRVFTFIRRQAPAPHFRVRTTNRVLFVRIFASVADLLATSFSVPVSNLLLQHSVHLGRFRHPGEHGHHSLPDSLPAGWVASSEQPVVPHPKRAPAFVALRQ